jgi:hypothetical protein
MPPCRHVAVRPHQKINVPWSAFAPESFFALFRTGCESSLKSLQRVDSAARIDAGEKWMFVFHAPNLRPAL